MKKKYFLCRFAFGIKEREAAKRSKKDAERQLVNENQRSIYANDDVDELKRKIFARTGKKTRFRSAEQLRDILWRLDAEEELHGGLCSKLSLTHSINQSLSQSVTHSPTHSVTQ